MKNKTIIILATLFILLTDTASWACEACAKQQPKITQGFTHGAGPDSNWDWLIIATMTAITVLTFIFSLKYLIKPGEKNYSHIKQSILNN
jgi:hypothetical protein